MKGSKEILWTFISIAILLVLVGIFVSPLRTSAAEIVRNDARYQAMEIAGILNILQASPDMTIHSYELPKDECTISIDNSVTVSMNDAVYSVELPHPIDPVKIECKEKKINFIKKGKITVEKE